MFFFLLGDSYMLCNKNIKVNLYKLYCPFSHFSPQPNKSVFHPLPLLLAYNSIANAHSISNCHWHSSQKHFIVFQDFKYKCTPHLKWIQKTLKMKSQLDSICNYTSYIKYFFTTYCDDKLWLVQHHFCENHHWHHFYHTTITSYHLKPQAVVRF